MLSLALLRNFEEAFASISLTTYAVPPRGRRPYTGAHILFAQETLVHPAQKGNKKILNGHDTDLGHGIVNGIAIIEFSVQLAIFAADSIIGSGLYSFRRAAFVNRKTRLGSPGTTRYGACLF
jgi:hypothetical protein